MKRTHSNSLPLSEMPRRNFVTTLGMGLLSLPVQNILAQTATTAPVRAIPYTQTRVGKRWYKGNTHMHTIRSDGEVFPLEAAALFKREGFNFICLTDHNITANEPFAPIPVDSPKGKKVKIEKLKPCKVAQNAEGKECYCPPSFEDVSSIVNEPEKFLVLSGNEVSCAPVLGKELHCNFINYHKPCRLKNKNTVQECLDAVREEYQHNANSSPYSFMCVNHPLWVSYDVPPSLIADREDLLFFEVCNSGSMPRFNLPGDEFTHDKWWDVVNTIRALRGQPLIYGIASDDIHNYTKLQNQEKRIDGYVQVLAEHLTAKGLVEAFLRGDFYASTGITLEAITFNKATRTLTVTVDPVHGDDCRISFIGSKKGVDTSVQETVRWEIKGELNSWLVNTRKFSRSRTVERYSADIGKIFKSVKGRTASYTIQPDDLYVRAKVVTPADAKTDNRENLMPVAWTQPILAVR